MMASFAEGLVLSEKVGLDPSVLVEVFPDKTNSLFLRLDPCEYASCITLSS